MHEILLDRYFAQDGASNFAANSKMGLFSLLGSSTLNVKRNEISWKIQSWSELAICLSAGIIRQWCHFTLPAARPPEFHHIRVFIWRNTICSLLSFRACQCRFEMEKTATYNAGIDLSSSTNALTLHSKLIRATPQTCCWPCNCLRKQGFSSRLMNFGKTSNKGIELTVNYDVIPQTRLQLANQRYGCTHDKQMVDEIGLVGESSDQCSSYGSQFMISWLPEGVSGKCHLWLPGMQAYGKARPRLTRIKIDKKYVSTSYVPGRQRYALTKNRDAIE